MIITLVKDAIGDEVVVAGNPAVYPKPQPEGKFLFIVPAVGGKYYECEITNIRELARHVESARNRLTFLTRRTT